MNACLGRRGFIQKLAFPLPSNIRKRASKILLTDKCFLAKHVHYLYVYSRRTQTYFYKINFDYTAISAKVNQKTEWLFFLQKDSLLLSKQRADWLLNNGCYLVQDSNWTALIMILPKFTTLEYLNGRYCRVVEFKLYFLDFLYLTLF